MQPLTITPPQTKGFWKTYVDSDDVITIEWVPLVSFDISDGD